ncbi:hypothetical protein [Sediminicoccus sp. BL-A-41-H5]
MNKPVLPGVVVGIAGRSDRAVGIEAMAGVASGALQGGSIALRWLSRGL